MKICVASKNPAKLEAVRRGFALMFPEANWPIDGVSVPSGVSEQPCSCDETYLGALNRLEAAREARPEAQFWVGIEGGLEHKHDQWLAFAWILVRSGERLGKSRTGSFFLAPRIAELVESGMEMGHADDLVFGTQNSKQGLGATGILTGGAIDRAGFYAHAVALALIPFRNPDVYT